VKRFERRLRCGVVFWLCVPEKECSDGVEPEAEEEVVSVRVWVAFVLESKADWKLDVGVL
jgi:hypothetical protein